MKQIILIVLMIVTVCMITCIAYRIGQLDQSIKTCLRAISLDDKECFTQEDINYIAIDSKNKE